MSEFLNQLHLLRPEWLLLAPVLPLLLWLQRRRRARGAWHAHCDPALLAYLSEPGAVGGRRGLFPLVVVAWLVAVVALAGPAWERAEQKVYRSGGAVVLVLDLSRSMDAADVVPSRLVRARFKAADLLSRSADSMVGLVVFAGDAFAIAPLTDDVNTLLNLLPPLETALMPTQGGRADLGLAMGVELLRRAGASGGEIILLTDDAPPAAVDAARSAHEAGHRVSVLAIGTASGAPIPTPTGDFLKDRRGNIVLPGVDNARLLAVAEAGSGRLATLSPDDSDIDRLLLPGSRREAREAQEDRRGSLRFVDRGPWLLLALLPLAALAFRRGWLLGVAGVSLLLPPAPVTALDWADLWSRPEQQVREALEEGDTASALEAAGDAPPAWQGAARYRDGDFEGAAEAFANAEDAEAAYNQGNALARAGRLEEALAAYDAALSRSPGMEDARFNRDLVQSLLDAQQQQQQQQQQDEDGRGEQDKEEPAQPGGQRSEGGEQSAEGQDDSDAGEAAPEANEQTAEATNDGGQEAGAEEPGDEAGNGDAGGAQRAQSGSQGQEEDGATMAAGEPPARDAEEEARIDRILRRVPDDPGGLLRRKFAIEHARRARDDSGEEQPW